MTKPRPGAARRPPRSQVPLTEKAFVRLSAADTARLERLAERKGWTRGEAMRAAIREWMVAQTSR